MKLRDADSVTVRKITSVSLFCCLQNACVLFYCKTPFRLYSQDVLKEVLKDYLITMCFVYIKVGFAFKLKELALKTCFFEEGQPFSNKVKR